LTSSVSSEDPLSSWKVMTEFRRKAESTESKKRRGEEEKEALREGLLF